MGWAKRSLEALLNSGGSEGSVLAAPVELSEATAEAAVKEMGPQIRTLTAQQVRHVEGSLALPQVAVREAKAEIAALIFNRDKRSADYAYAELLRVISHPAAILRLRLVRGGPQLRRRLNLLILVRRLLWLACVGLIAVAFLAAWWYLLGLPVALLLDMTIISRLQTRTNLEIGARLTFFDTVLLRLQIL
ncbi:MAG: hypothetical protein ACYTF6_07090 [Planctomycetota bacterium]|jgi:hypothetical protein